MSAMRIGGLTEGLRPAGESFDVSKKSGRHDENVRRPATLELPT